MKIWIKLVIGIGIGITLSFFFPGTNAKNLDLFTYLKDLFIHIGRYSLFPLVFFSLAVGTAELKQERRLFKVYMRIILYMITATAVFVILGTASVLLFSPDRIPIIVEKHDVLVLPGIRDILLMLFPLNLFKALVIDGTYLLPICFLAFFLGQHFTFDKLSARPTADLFDSLSRIFYRINDFIVEILAFGMIAIAAYSIMQIQIIAEIELFKQLIIVLIVDSLVIVLGILPGFLFLFCGRKNPYKWLYALVAPALTAFFSADAYFSMGMLMKHGKSNLGIPRKIGSAAFPLFALFGKAGTALVTSVSFILILRSYSSLEIGFFQVLWVMLLSFLVSFALGPVPGLGSIVGLSLICSLYGNGLEEGYFILKPVAPLLVSFGTLFDIITAGLVSFLVARQENAAEEIEMKNFI